MSEQIIITNGLKIKKRVSINQAFYGIVRNLGVLNEGFYDLELHKHGRVKLLTNLSLEQLVKEIETGLLIIISEEIPEDYTMD